MSGLVALVIAAAAGASAAEAPPEDVERFLAALSRMEDAIGDVRDYTCTFTKQERIRGELHLPTQLTTWDEEERLLGSYGYRAFELNVGLGDADFDVENDAYGF